MTYSPSLSSSFIYRHLANSESSALLPLSGMECYFARSVDPTGVNTGMEIAERTKEEVGPATVSPS